MTNREVIQGCLTSVALLRENGAQFSLAPSEVESHHTIWDEEGKEMVRSMEPGFASKANLITF